MKYQLKYLIPILIFILGISVTGANIFFYTKNEHIQFIDSKVESIHIIGNRITKEIEHKQLYDRDSFAELTRIFSQYTLEHLNSAKIYDEKNRLIFKSSPVKYSTNENKNDMEIINQVILEKKSYVSIDEKEFLIDVVFPLVMPLKQGELYSKSYGALYLEFDMSMEHAKQLKNIYKYSIVNALVILFMVSFLALLLYLLILRRLNNLHEMTKKISDGNYDARVETSFNDELGEVNKAFNEMAEKISKNQKELEFKVAQVMQKNEEHNHLMMQQHRLIAMGEMINNIAHQWRQPLNVLGLILQKFEIFYNRGTLDEAKIHNNVEKGMLQVEKMSSTIDDFRNFFKQDKEKHQFYLKELIQEVLLFMQSTIEEHRIEITHNIEPSVEMSGYKNELIQVIVNLINNAKDALVEKLEEGRVICINCIVKDETMIMEIKDNAGGIPNDIIDKIFEPYFTTKSDGNGTGIGLYMSKMIIEENMNGKLKVANGKDGAVFSIILDLDHIHPVCEIYCDIKKGNYENR